MSWTNSYIGIPFLNLGRDRGGCDCYGLVVLVYREKLGIQLASYHEDYVSCEEREEIDGLFCGGVSQGPWGQVEEPSMFDIALFRRGRGAAHCGVVVTPGLMLHVCGDDQAKLERYCVGAWKHRLIGHFRHKKMRAIA
ncbi:NLP/P60 protein [Roseibium sp. TrichSKD4]|uniref:NlpC/P60 family protein n=1 Tax=Roseibium sp. TrichSKD4 TaxID=744980 RepID=UPI0001E5637C|nr:NlpC/P60 family protein [Roseibium sp. TrichSKD4]EFO33894.1 NLP/P60 protein [Roseibium sp. TrichSKD4]